MRYKSKKDILYIVFFAFSIIGIIAGTLVANSINFMNYPNINNLILKFNINFEIYNRNFNILNTFMEYGSIILFIWALGFTSIAVYSDIILIITGGFIYGYIISDFFIKYSFKGILFFIILYLIESLIFLPTLFRILYMSIEYSISGHNYFNIFRETKKYIRLDRYIIEILFALISVFLISLVDTYFISIFIGLF